MNNKCLTFELKTLEKWQTSAETTKSWTAFANASLDFPGEIGNCVSAKTSNLGKDKHLTKNPKVATANTLSVPAFLS